MTLCLVNAGGTIAGWREDEGLRMLSGQELLQLLPNPTGDIVVRDLVLEPSWNLRDGDMERIARNVIEAAASDFEGVIVTHGTDTMEDTLFLTDLLAGATLSAPLVFSGAMGFASERNGDAVQNLTDAIRLARIASASELGPVLCMCGEIHAASHVRKVDATSINAFSSWPLDPLGRIGTGELVIDRKPRRDWPYPPEKIETAVAVVKTFPGVDGGILKYHLDNGARGLVVEGTGGMNVPRSLLAEIERAASKDVPVVISSSARVAGGLDQPSVGSGVLHDLGAIGSYGLSTVKARVALMVALGTSKRVEEVRDWFSSTFREHQLDVEG